jgi:hypothetical protein
MGPFACTVQENAMDEKQPAGDVSVADRRSTEERTISRR